MYASSVIARGKAAMQGTETEQRVAVLLYDDAVQVISSFELNQLASLTYHEAQVITSATDMTDTLLEHLEQIMKSPVSYSTISVQKSLVVAKHILLHGAEKIVQLIRMQLGRYVEQLTQYNTVLLAQQQAGAWLMRLKGGSVDYGGPVREVAVALHNLLQSPQALAYERSVSADPTSLVPVGSRQQVAFATDQVRFQHLKKQMEEQQKIILKSNLKKASDGFGSGYMAADGKTVVGAAHGIEEMLAMKQREEQKFRDEQQNAAAARQRQEQATFSEYQAPSVTQPPVYYNSNQPQQQQQQHQQQYYSHEQYQQPAAPAPAPQVDLLDLGNETTSTPGITPAVSQEEDLLFGGTTAAPTTESTYTLGLAHDPFQATVPSAVPVAVANSHGAQMLGLLGVMSLGSQSSSNTPATEQPKVVMSTNEDRFAALDVLASGTNPLAAISPAAPSANGMPMNSGTGTGMPMNRSALSMSNSNSTGMPTVSNAYAGLLGPTGSSVSSKDAFATLGATFSAPAPPPSLNVLTNLNHLTANQSSFLLQQQPQQQQPMSDHSFAMPPQQVQPPPMFAMPPDLSSIRVSDMGFAAPGMTDDSESGFVMGGHMGAGLAPAPAVAPPPPPPGGW